MAKKKRSSPRFTFLVRKRLLEIWGQEYLKLGIVDRWTCRTKCWNTLVIPMQMFWDLMRQRFEIAEQRVLKSNQTALRKAIHDARQTLASQPSLPGMYVNELHTQLSPISEYFIKIPGPDKDFAQLVKVRDLDFDIIYDMATVRDEKEEELMLSLEDYNFMDHVRMQINVPRTITLGQAFAV